MRLSVGLYMTILVCSTVGLLFVLADKLMAPKILKVIYFEKNSTLAVGFSKEPPLNDFLDEYRVVLNSDNRVVMCSTNCSSVILLDVCESYYSRDLIFFSTVSKITVRLIRSKGKKVISSSKTTTGFNLYQQVCPESVVNMALNYANSSVMSFSFQPSENTKRKIGLMNYYEKPLSYKVTLTSSEGYQKHLFLQTQFLKTVYWLSERGQQNVAVNLQDLAPNFKYTVSVSSVGGGGESEAKLQNFTTLKSVPLKPPILPPFSFVRFPSLGLSAPDETCVFMTWQPLPEEYIGGATLYYYVDITRLGTNISKAINVTAHFITELMSLHSHLITIWAANEIGLSENFSQVTIPDSTEFNEIPIYVAFNNDTTADIFVHLPESYSLQSLAIHWCVSEKSFVCRTQYICKGSLHTRHFTQEKRGKTHNFTISLLAICKKFTSESKRNITYVDFESEGDHSAETRKAVASVTETEYRLVNTDNVDHQENGDHQENRDTCTRKDTENVGPKAFFVSIKGQGRWMGMRPARCYYHNDAKTVDLQVNQTYDEVKNIVLNIQQRCDTEPAALNAKQFLVKQFIIYSSNNNACNTQRLVRVFLVSKATTYNGDCVVSSMASCHFFFTTIGRYSSELGKILDIIDNDIYIPISYKLPPGLLYVCVVAVGQSNSFNISRIIVYPKAALGGLSDTTIIAVVAAMIIIILAFALGLIYKKCIDRQRYFEHLWKSESFSSFKNMDNICSKSYNEENITKCIPSGGQYCQNTDSGCASYKAQRLDSVNQSLTEPASTVEESLVSKPHFQDSGCPHPDLVREPLLKETITPRHYCRMNFCEVDDSSCAMRSDNAANNSSCNTGSHDSASNSNSDDTYDIEENSVLSDSLSGQQISEIKGVQSNHFNINNCSYGVLEADFVLPNNS